MTLKNNAHTLFSFSVFLLLILTSCNKDPEPFNPLDASNMEGNWVDMTGTFAPDWHYQFQSGLLTQSYQKFGSTVTTLQYPYAVRDSVLIIGGDATNSPREWTVFFECHDVVRITQSSTMIGQRFWLKRE